MEKIPERFRGKIKIDEKGNISKSPRENVEEMERELEESRKIFEKGKDLPVEKQNQLWLRIVELEDKLGKKFDNKRKIIGGQQYL